MAKPPPFSFAPQTGGGFYALHRRFCGSALGELCQYCL